MRKLVTRSMPGHDVKVIQTWPRSHVEMLKSGEERPGPPLVEVGESGSKSGNSDCTDDQCGEETDRLDRCGRNVKFGQGKKRPSRLRLDIIAPQASEEQVLGWDKTSVHDGQLKDPNIGPVLG